MKNKINKICELIKSGDIDTAFNQFSDIVNKGKEDLYVQTKSFMELDDSTAGMFLFFEQCVLGSNIINDKGEKGELRPFLILGYGYTDQTYSSITQGLLEKLMNTSLLRDSLPIEASDSIMVIPNILKAPFNYKMKRIKELGETMFDIAFHDSKIDISSSFPELINDKSSTVNSELSMFVLAGAVVATANSTYLDELDSGAQINFKKELFKELEDSITKDLNLRGVIVDSLFTDVETLNYVMKDVIQQSSQIIEKKPILH